MPPRLDFYFFIGSTYSHLSVSRAAALAKAAGVDLVWRPFSVRTLMREQNNSPFVGKPVKMRYMWRDLERRAQRFGVPFDGIPPYPIDPDELANRVAMLAAIEAWCPAFAASAYRAWFIDKQDRVGRRCCARSSAAWDKTPNAAWPKPTRPSCATPTPRRPRVRATSACSGRRPSSAARSCSGATTGSTCTGVGAAGACRRSMKPLLP
ncbi:MAG: DsbA family protein [Rubrivivax sp.]